MFLYHKFCVAQEWLAWNEIQRRHACIMPFVWLKNCVKRNNKDGSRMAWNERSKNALFVWLTTDLLRLLLTGGCLFVVVGRRPNDHLSTKCIASPKLINLTFLKYMSQNKVNKPYLPEIYESKCIASPKLINLTFLIPKTNCLQDTHRALENIMQTIVLELTARNLMQPWT